MEDHKHLGMHFLCLVTNEKRLECSASALHIVGKMRNGHVLYYSTLGSYSTYNALQYENAAV